MTDFRRSPGKVSMLLLACIAALVHAVPIVPREAQGASDGKLPPGEEYRQLTIIAGLSNGASPRFIDELKKHGSSAAGPPDSTNSAGTSENLETLSNPIVRIADPGSLILGGGKSNRAGSSQERRNLTTTRRAEAGEPSFFE